MDNLNINKLAANAMRSQVSGNMSGDKVPPDMVGGRHGRRASMAGFTNGSDLEGGRRRRRAGIMMGGSDEDGEEEDMDMEDMMGGRRRRRRRRSRRAGSIAMGGSDGDDMEEKEDMMGGSNVEEPYLIGGRRGRGRRSRTRRSHTRRSRGRRGKSRSASRKKRSRRAKSVAYGGSYGALVKEAIVPFGLFALQSRSNSKKQNGLKTKQNKTFRKSRNSRN
jgi:hypothetical protein